MSRVRLTSRPKVQYTLRVETDMMYKIKYMARKDFRTINAQFEFLLLDAIRKYEASNGKIVVPKRFISD